MSYNRLMPATEPILFYGTTWCGLCRRTRHFLDRHNIPYFWRDIDRDPEAAAFVESVNRGMRSVPTLVWPDGSRLVEPGMKELAARLGLPTE